MPGNEKVVAKFLVSKKNQISLRHLGKVVSVGAPSQTGGAYIELNTLADAERLLSTQDSRKKADIYINGKGISVKQGGATFSYNRLQRANLLEVFHILGFSVPVTLIKRLDVEVGEFHKQKLDRRNRDWQNFFSEDEFNKLTEYLMMKGAPNVGFSSHPAEFILEAPSGKIDEKQLQLYTFDEYFALCKNKFKIAIRRQWYGQASQSEHNRARGLMKKPENAPWVFNGVVGAPNVHRSGKRWRDEVAPAQRKTVYFLMIEKER